MSPLPGLDPKARRELIEFLATLPQTMIIATHDLEMARQLTTRMVILKQGQIVHDAPTGQVLAQPDLLFANDLA